MAIFVFLPVLGYTDEENGIYQATPDKPVIIFDDFTGSFKWVDFNFKIKSSAIKIITVKEDFILLRYLFHMMGKINFTSSAHRRLWIETYSNFKIPVPPLPVQNEIVRILDTFTELISELAKELQLRKKQYEYYRDKLLTFENVPMVKLGEIAVSISSGKNKVRSENGKYPVYGSTGVISKTDIPVYDFEQILVARVGANAGYVHLANNKYDVSDNTLILNVNKKYSLKYVYYTLINMNLNQYAKGGGQPLITAGDLKKLFIPVPPIEEQERIAGILDKFDKLCNDLCEGIPAEIEARKKQYEYYRDLLLTFEEAK